tara:strand:- start:882 stop:998 length:117 start_codon:yes stop_codon:yes gene_type:complete
MISLLRQNIIDTVLGRPLRETSSSKEPITSLYIREQKI